ncbi:MAG: TM2 domain-containing protein [Eubacteriales bacterium]|nr:TM2 domain-containing protein [Eubacteriales bacterium]
MSKETVQIWLQSNAKYFPEGQTLYLQKQLESLSEDKFLSFTTLDYKDPTTMTIISIFVGGLGVDRFMLGETGMGVLKLLTGGVCGILWLIDLFSIGKKTKEFNLNKLNMMIAGANVAEGT